MREHGGAVDAVVLAQQTGLHVTTVRFHLDTLCDQGLLSRARIRRAGVGRPRIGYRAVQGRLDYRALAEILGQEMGDTDAERRRRAEQAGYRWGCGMAARSGDADSGDPDDPGTELERRTGAIAEVFQRMGFRPELTPAVESADGHEQAIRLHDCPVRELATSDPDLSCSVHLGLLRGLLDKNTDPDDRTAWRGELEPFVRPDVCVAKVIAVD